MVPPRPCEGDGRDAGLFKVLQPKRWGGYEMDPRVFYRDPDGAGRRLHGHRVDLRRDRRAQLGCRCSPSRRSRTCGPRIQRRSSRRPTCRWARPRKSTAATASADAGAGRAASSTANGSSSAACCRRRTAPARWNTAPSCCPKGTTRWCENFDVLGLRGDRQPRHRRRGAFVPEHRTHRTNDHSDAACLGAPQPGWLYQDPVHAGVPACGIDRLHRRALDGAVGHFRERAAAHVGKHGKDRRGPSTRSSPSPRR